MTHIYRYGYMHPLPWREEPVLVRNEATTILDGMEHENNMQIYNAWLASRIPVPEEHRHCFDEGCAYQKEVDFMIEETLHSQLGDPIELVERVAFPIIKTNQEDKMTPEEKYRFLTGRDKPFFIDTFRKLLNQFDKEEISMSKFVEELNITAYKWMRDRVASQAGKLVRIDEEKPTKEGVSSPQGQEWETFCDASYYDLWAVRPIGDGDFSSQKLFHVQTREEAYALRDLLNSLQPTLQQQPDWNEIEAACKQWCQTLLDSPPPAKVVEWLKSNYPSLGAQQPALSDDNKPNPKP